MFTFKLKPIKNTLRSLGGSFLNHHGLLIFSFFIALNTLKIVIFDLYLTPSHEISFFLYKFITTLLMLLVLYFTFFKLKRPILFIIFYVIQLLYLFATFSYFLYFRSFLHILQSIMLLTEGLEAFKASASPKSPALLILLLDFPLFIYLLFLYKGTVSKLRLRRFKINVALLACIVLLLGIEGWHFIKKDSLYHLLVPSINPIKVTEAKIVEKYGTLANNMADMLILTNEKPLINSMKYGKEISSDGKTQSMSNIIVIQVESMDSNIVNTKYKDKYVMPFLKSLTKESVYYPYTLSYHMGGATSDTEFSVINSIEPLPSYPAIKLNSYEYANSYIRVLKDNSYFTAAFHGNVGYYFNRAYALPKMGFQEFNDMLKMKLKDELWGAADHKVFNYTRDRIKSLPSPYLAHIITMTSHGPFINAETFYSNPHYADMKNKLEKDYFTSMSYVDQSIRDFVRDVQKNSPDTEIVIFGDHTPNVNGEFYKQASFLSGNHYLEFVPLFILTKDKKIYEETTKVASFLDLSPTILNLSGAKYRIRSDGLDLLKPSEDPPPIPYKGENYDREILFSKIRQIH